MDAKDKQDLEKLYALLVRSSAELDYFRAKAVRAKVPKAQLLSQANSRLMAAIDKISRYLD